MISCKMSQVQDLIAVYRSLARRCDYALHLGLTEAGMGSKGIVASSAAMAVLLQEGIGDTIRVSLTPEPGGSRTREVQVAQELLQTMGLRAFTPMVSACPGCGRTTSTVFQDLARKTAYRAQADGVRFFEGLVKEGEEVQQRAAKAASHSISDARARASGTWGRLENVFEDRVAQALHSLNVPTKKDIDDLGKRVSELTVVTKKLAASGRTTKQRARSAR